MQQAPLDRFLEALAAHGRRVKSSGSGIMAQCPCHDDAKESLSVGLGDHGGVILHCFAGCQPGDIVAAVGMQWLDLFPENLNRSSTSGNAQRQHVYEIRDAAGNLVAEHVRIEKPDGKIMRWRRAGQWNLGGMRVRQLPLYRSETIAGRPGDPVIVTEGEKAADAAAKRGLLAVGTVTGASSAPCKESFAVLTDRDVILWPDADEPGRLHMILCARLAREAGARSIRILRWPDAPAGGDAADFSGDDDALRALLGGVTDVADIQVASAGKVDKAAATGRPMILIAGPDGQTPLHVLVPAAIERLAASPDAGIYVRPDGLAHVVTSGGSPGSPPRIVPISRPALREVLDRVATWAVMGKEEPSERLAPTEVVEALRDRGVWPGLRWLDGITTTPTMRPDGSVLATPGYDAETRLLYAPMRAYPEVPEHPDRGEVDDAVDALRDPWSEFPCATEDDRASILALALSVAARPAIIGPVPMFALMSPTQGTGKTLLAQSVVAAMTGTMPDLMAMPGGRGPDAEAEIRKRITTLVTEGSRVAVLDNVADGAMLESSALAAVLTADEITERILGSSRTIRATARTVWIATGNNITLAPDLARRSLAVSIDARVEDPHQRAGFAIASLLPWARKNHPKLVVAALTILRGYVAEGMPSHGRPSLGSFDEWDRLIRGAVWWATGRDAAVTERRLRAESPEQAAVGAVLAAWHMVRGNAPTRSVDLLTMLPVADAIREAIPSRSGDLPSPVAIGRWLARYAGRIVGGLHLERMGADRDGKVMWRVHVSDGRSEDARMGGETA